MMIKKTKIKLLMAMFICMLSISLFPATITAQNTTRVLINNQELKSGQVYQYGEGTVLFDAKTSTLQLKNATIEEKGDCQSVFHITGDLTIELNGNNTISSNEKRPIYTGLFTASTAEVMIKGSSKDKLTITTNADAIQSDGGNITIDGCTLEVTSHNWSGISAHSASNSITDVGGKLTIQNHAKVTINSGSLALAGDTGISINDSVVELTVNGNSNAVYSEQGVIEISNSSLEANSFSKEAYPVVYGASDINIVNSNVEVSLFEIQNNFGIYAYGQSINVSGNSDVTVNGGIYAAQLVLTPAAGQMLEAKVGNIAGSATDAKHYKDSPYAKPVSFAADSDLANYIYVRIKPHNHTGGTATCTEQAICDDCLKPYGNALGHQAVKIEAKAATCSKYGNIEYWYCDVCGKYFKDEALTEEIDKESTIIKASGHDIGSKWKFDETNHWNECLKCGAIFDQDAHSNKWVIDKKATSTSTGLKHEECTVCDHVKDAVEIPILETPNDPSDDITIPDTLYNNIALWLEVICITGIALSAMVLYRRKRKYNK